MKEFNPPSTLLPAQIFNIKRRRQERTRCKAGLLAALTLPGAGRSAEVWLRDLSPAGLGFTSATAMAVGQDVTIKLKKHAAVSAIRLDVRVVHCTAESENCWHVGCEFREPLSDQLIEYLAH